MTKGKEPVSSDQNNVSKGDHLATITVNETKSNIHSLSPATSFFSGSFPGLLWAFLLASLEDRKTVY